MTCRCGHPAHVGTCRATDGPCYCIEGYTEDYRRGWEAGREFERRLVMGARPIENPGTTTSGLTGDRGGAHEGPLRETKG
jgi:hypothetical protein